MTTPPPQVTLPDDLAEALELVSAMIRMTVHLTTAQLGEPPDEYAQGIAQGVESAAMVLDSAARGVRRRRGEVVS